MSAIAIERPRFWQRVQSVVGAVGIAAVALVTATAAFAQPAQFQINPNVLNQLPNVQLQQSSRLVIIQGGGLAFLDATQPDKYNLGLQAVIAQGNTGQSQQWLVVDQGNGMFTIQQRSSGLFLDAHEIAGEDFAVVLRTRQTFDQTQLWRIQEYGGGFVTIQQVSSGRFLQPYIDAAHGYMVVTRPQGDQLQEWRFGTP